MKRQIATVFSLVISATLTLPFSTFTYPFLILTLPGLLFGLALTIPMIHPYYKTHKTELAMIIVYPGIWAISFGLYFMFQLITPSLSDKTPYIIVGLLSGLGTVIIFDYQFELKNRWTGILTVTVLSVIAVLLGDFFFPNPHDKELNIGKQVAIWEILVGLCLVANRKTPANK